MRPVYVPLRLRSHYSLLRGTASIERLVKKARDYGFPALALTDRNNLYGAIPFFQKARAAGLKPIVGAEIAHEGEAVTLLARDLEGYSNICRIITRLNLDDRFRLPGALERFGEGIHILTEDPSLARILRGRVGGDRLWLEIAAPGRGETARRKVQEAARDLGLPLVATPDAYFSDPDEHELHRVLTAIRENTLVSRLGDDDVAHPGSYFLPSEAMERIFAGMPEALENTLLIADDCNLEIPIGKPIFPRYPIPEGETAYSLLYKMAHQGLERRYRPISPEAMGRLTHELEVIYRLGFAEYFLVVADIARYARERRIPAVGRGSGASSIVAYLLGITGVDPLKYRIHFERFLNFGRTDYPDIDLDFCWKSRDDVIAYTYERYGADRVAMISTHITFQPRSAFREVAKAYGVPNEEVNRLSRRIPRGEGRLPDLIESSHARGRIPIREEPFRTIVRLADRLQGSPNHLSIHCGGIVIGDRPLDTYVPLERAAKGIVITQYEMNAVEDVGLVKIDLLGNRALSTVRETIDLLEETGGGPIDPEAIPDEDPETISLIQRGRTIGCNQLESPAMRNLLQMLRPDSMVDVMKALALIRPGPAGIGMKDRFVRRARGMEPVTFPHPNLREILDDSYGIMLYEDDAMLVASSLAGLSLDEGDRLRKAIGKARTEEEMLRVSRFFLNRCARAGVSRKAAEEIWVQMAKFNSYSFCKAHAAGYGILAYWCAYMKAHHPAEFLVAVMNHHAGMYEKRVHVEEARRMGVEIRLPCVNRSRDEFTAEEGAIRVGLGQIKGLSEKTIRSILGERDREGPFGSLGELLVRTEAGEKETEDLILAGAFDFCGRTRPALLWELKATYDAARRARGKGSLLGVRLAPSRAPDLPEHPLPQRVFYELELLGLSVSAHPMRLFRPLIEAEDLLCASDLGEHIGEQVRLAGLLDAARRTETSRGDFMEFVTLEDETGVFEVTLFPRVYRRDGHVLGVLGPYLVEGRVDCQHDAVTLTANRLGIAPLREEAGAAVLAETGASE